VLKPSDGDYGGWGREAADADVLAELEQEWAEMAWQRLEGIWS
jgi:hypothetical protein